MQAQPFEVHVYSTPEGEVPLTQWHQAMKNPVMKLKVAARLERIGLGNLGDWKALTDHAPLIELRDASGYRLYCVRRGQELIILCGGLKADQTKDIGKALKYWHDYEQRQG